MNQTIIPAPLSMSSVLENTTTLPTCTGCSNATCQKLMAKSPNEQLQSLASIDSFVVIGGIRPSNALSAVQLPKVVWWVAAPVRAMLLADNNVKLLITTNPKYNMYTQQDVWWVIKLLLFMFQKWCTHCHYNRSILIARWITLYEVIFEVTI